MSQSCHNGRPECCRALILVNPKAGRGPSPSQLDQLVSILQRRLGNVVLSADLAQVCAQANDAHHHGRLQALVGVGGDGTAAELVNRTSPGVPICLYPSGTSNLLARYLGLRPDPAAVAEAIVDRSLVNLDAGSANGRVFLMMAGCGFDAQVVRDVHHRREQKGGGHLSYWSYAKPILAAIRSYQYPEIQVYCEGAPASTGLSSTLPWVGRWAFAFNLPLYGWGLPLAYWSDGTDGLLDVCTLQRGSWWHGLRYLAAAQRRRLRRLRDCQVGRATRVKMTSERPVAYQLDGDPGGWLPLDIQVLPRRLTFVVPRGHRLRA